MTWGMIHRVRKYPWTTGWLLIVTTATFALEVAQQLHR